MPTDKMPMICNRDITQRFTTPWIAYPPGQTESSFLAISWDISSSFLCNHGFKLRYRHL